MLKFTERFGKYIATAGFKEVKIESIESFLTRTREIELPNTHMQFFDARFVATWQHLYFAALNALMAFENNDNISKNLAIESILYASAQRQIRKAMKLLGIRRDSSEIAVLVVTEKPDFVKSALSNILRQTKGRRDDEILALSERKIRAIRKIFGISDVEVETTMRKDGAGGALLNIVIERMALLATQH